MSPPHPLDLLHESIAVVGEAVSRAAEVPHALPTPCAAWSLGVLVRHVADSASSLRELLLGEPAGGPPLPGCSAAQTAFASLDCAVAAAPRDDGAVMMAALTGSYELTLHAWDVNEATAAPTGRMPGPLVDALLVQAPLVLGHGQRCGLFGPEIAVAAGEGDLDRLLGLFGRSRRWRTDGRENGRWNGC